MNDKTLRDRLNRIRDAQKIITNEINLIYNENAESNALCNKSEGKR
jgi:hypothetical protein